MITDKEMFIDFLNKIKIDYILLDNFNYIIIKDSEVEDWDLSDYTTIIIEFDTYDKYVKFRLVSGLAKEWENRDNHEN